MKGHHDIYIIRIDREYRVKPAVWSTDADRMKGNNIIGFRNFTPDTVLVDLPARLLPHRRAKRLTLQPKRKKGDAGEITLRAGTRSLAGVHPYKVTVKIGRKGIRVKGDSEPIIIIDPPPQ